MKIKRIAVITLLIVLLVLCVCSNLNILPSIPSTAPEEALSYQATSSAQEATQPDETTPPTHSETAKPETSSDKVTAPTSSVTANSQTSHSKETTSEYKTTQKTSTIKKPETTTIKKDDSVITVSVYCSCKNAIDYGIRTQKSHLPENGIILNTTVTVKKGSNALAAIKEACNKSGIKIDEKRGYIRGINDLYEKDCGGASGWMYSVNGTFPNMSSDKYTLNPGDRIELHYTVKLGDVS